MTDYKLTDAQLAQFFADGFFAPIPAYLAPEKCDAIRESFLSIEKNRTPNPVFKRFSLRDWHLVDPLLNELLSHPGLHEPVSQILGNESLILWRSMCFNKPPRAGELGWHQEWGQFRGDEIGGVTPSLRPHERFATGPQAGQPWDMTIWVALDDITPEMGPVRFIRGSHKAHHPVKMVPLTDSAFKDQVGSIYEYESVEELVRRSQDLTLLIEPVPTANFFDGVDVERLSLRDAQELVMSKLSKLEGEVTVDFEPDPARLVEVPLKKGELVLFFERTMHGSGANRTDRGRVGVSCRVTHADTVVYPERMEGNYIDGMNLNIRDHRCVHLCGDYRNPQNVYLDAASPASPAKRGRSDQAAQRSA